MAAGTQHVAIHTVRPDLLVGQVGAFFENYRAFARARGVCVRFHVFVDGTSRDDAFREAAEAIASTIAGEDGFSLRLWLRSDYEPRLPLDEPFFVDPLLRRLGGGRCIQNISEFVLHQSEVSPGDTVHRIDDDVYPLDLRMSDDALVLEQANDFFGEREALLQRREVRLLTSALAGDSPSPIGDVYWSLRTAAAVHRAAGSARPEADWSDVARELCPSVADRVVDPLGLLDTAPLRLHATFAEVQAQLAELLENLRRGRGRVVYAPSSFYRSETWISGPWIGPRYYGPNAAICHRAGEPIHPSFPYGNPDIVTFASDAVWRGGGVWGAPPVLHLKSSALRTSLFDLGAIEQKHDYLRTRGALVHLAASAAPEARDAITHIIDYAERQLVEIRDFCEELGASSLARDADAFAEALLRVLARAQDPREAEEMMRDYRAYCDRWTSLVRRTFSART